MHDSTTLPRHPRHRFAPAFVLSLFAASLALPAIASAGDVLHLRCGARIDAKNAAALGPATLVIEAGKISAIEAPEVGLPEGARAIDLSEHTCMPGLMDMHVHLAGEYSRRSYLERFILNPTDRTIRAVVNAKKTLDAGFTTVRDLGSGDGSVISVRNAIRRGQIPGPTIFAAEKSLATTGGHADPTNGMRRELTGDPGPARGVVNGEQDAAKAVRQRYKAGADWIKITATGGVLSVAKNGQNPQFSEAEIRAIVATAQDYEIPVAAHAHGAEGMKRAIRAGVTSIEHGTLMDDEAIELFKSHGTWYVPTILAGEFVAEKAKDPGYFPEAVRPKAAAIGPQIKTTLGKAYSRGVKIAFGTDTGVSPHGENAKEFALMVEAGMPPLETIRAATFSAAELLGIEATHGTLAVGMAADIVAAPGDPAADIRVLEQIDFVLKAGAIHRAPASP